MLEIEPMALCVLGKISTMELQSQIYTLHCYYFIHCLIFFILYKDSKIYEVPRKQNNEETPVEAVSSSPNFRFDWHVVFWFQNDDDNLGKKLTAKQ